MQLAETPCDGQPHQVHQIHPDGHIYQPEDYRVSAVDTGRASESQRRDLINRQTPEAILLVFLRAQALIHSWFSYPA